MGVRASIINEWFDCMEWGTPNMAETYCLDTTDCFGRRIVFTDTQRELKARQRPELREEGILARIKQAVCNPTFVYPDLDTGNRLAYYTLEYRANNRSHYMKVVAKDRGEDMFIITAYRPDYVKERGKSTLKYGNDDQ